MATQEELDANLSDIVKNEAPAITRTFSRVRSVVDQYSQLVTGKGYDFYAFPNPVNPVSGAKTPLLPMIISVVPPEIWPTGETTTREISSPMEQEISLTSFRERFSGQGGQTALVTQIVPTDPGIGAKVDALQDQIKDLEARINRASGDFQQSLIAQRTTLERETDLLLASAPRRTEVDVPVNTPLGRAQQRLQVSDYMTGIRERYSSFRESSRKAAVQIRDKKSITGPNRKDETDTQGEDSAIRDARERGVRGDLLFLREQAERMVNLDPIFMYVNPESWERTYDFIVSDGNKTRSGYAVEFWGEQQLKIAASGKVGAFYVDSNDKLGESAGGLAVGARKGSYAYQQFMSLYQAYKSNGYIFNSDGSIALVGAISIFYDGAIYMGSFDSFTISQSEESPYSFDYNFAFTVRLEQRFHAFNA